MSGLALDILPALPIATHAARIAECVRDNQFVVVSGETGSGKTTQLPKICLAARPGVDGLLGHTQPRRLAARSVATRIAHETATRLGELVGYQVRFDRRVGARCRVKVMTDGILLAEVQGDPALLAYHTVIVDEAHERSLNIDFLLGHLKRLAPQRPELRVVISSATIDAAGFAEFLGGAPVVEVSGRNHPVEVRYRPGTAPEAGEDDSAPLLDAVQELYEHGSGDILVFLASEQEIHESSESLRRLRLPRTEIMPLFARLPLEHQQRVFEPHTGRRVILATNIAETSLTVPGVQYVIDSGRARISRYQHRHAIQRLPVEPISRAAADQRKGRCGRTAPGVCIRLYSEDDYRQRRAYNEPEIQRADLAAVLLRLKAMGVDDLAHFPLMSPPARRHVKDGERLLRELGALDPEAQLTPTGRLLASVPVDPRVGRMLIAASELDCLAEVLVIAAAMSVADPRQRPPGSEDAADAAHRRFRDERSDFMSLLRLWQLFHRHTDGGAGRRRAYCRKHFLAPGRMREWLDVHQQLRQVASEIGLARNRSAGTYARIHRALVTGLLRNVGCRAAERDYAGLREVSFRIAPGSGQYRRRPKWVVADELRETRRPYAHRVAEIQPEWVERSARDLLRRAHFEAHWDARRAEPMVYEQTALYGLTLSARRRVRFAPISREDARALFIRVGLVEGRFAASAPALEDHRRLIQSLRAYDHKLRRPDVLVSDEDVFAFYHQRLPAHVCDGSTFSSWLRRDSRAGGSALHMSVDDIARRSPDALCAVDFPDVLAGQDGELPLRYRFAPGEEDDGITAIIPVRQLGGLDFERFEWLVPGRWEEKVLALLRLLPKGLRRELMPLAGLAAEYVGRVEGPAGSLSGGLADYIRHARGLFIPPEPWDPDRLKRELEPYLLMRYEIIDESGSALDQGRDLGALQRRFGTRPSSPSRRRDSRERRGLTDWTVGTLAESISVEQYGARSTAFPTLVDRGRSVDLVLVDNRDLADELGRRGLRRLFVLRAGPALRRIQRQLARRGDLHLAYALVPEAPDTAAHALSVESASAGTSSLDADLLLAIVDRAFVEPAPAPRSRAQFEAALERGLERIPGVAEGLVRLCEAILAAYRAVRGVRDDGNGRVPSDNLADVDAQLVHLVYRGFIADTPYATLREYPRYLRALAIRLEKLRRGGARDGGKLSEFAPLWERYVGRARSHRERGRRDPELTRYRWMLEEYRVSLFAQEVGAAYRISRQRLEEQWRRVAS